MLENWWNFAIITTDPLIRFRKATEIFIRRNSHFLKFNFHTPSTCEPSDLDEKTELLW